MNQRDQFNVKCGDLTPDFARDPTLILRSGKGVVLRIQKSRPDPQGLWELL